MPHYSSILSSLILLPPQNSCHRLTPQHCFICWVMSSYQNAFSAVVLSFLICLPSRSMLSPCSSVSPIIHFICLLSHLSSLSFVSPVFFVIYLSSHLFYDFIYLSTHLSARTVSVCTEISSRCFTVKYLTCKYRPCLFANLLFLAVF